MFGDRVPDHSVPGLKVAKLICISGDVNSNKYYLMWEQTDGTFKVAYGRVQGSVTEEQFPMSRWNEKYKNKTSDRKGYKDVTHLYAAEEAQPVVVNEKKEVILDASDPLVMKLINTLQGYANKSISTNYTVTSDKVTQLMVDAAQEIINELVPLICNGSNVTELNKRLLELYRIIPRRMKNVKDHLIAGDTIISNMLDSVQKMIGDEQATLDVMAGQVKIIRDSKEIVTDTKQTNILDVLGINVSMGTAADADMGRDMMTDRRNSLHKIYRVENKKTQKLYNKAIKELKNSKQELLFHGSRNQNWLNILQTGLLIRPAGAITTGSMFGNSIYFADKADKSIGYSSYNGRWTNEHAGSGYIALYDVALGNQMHITRWHNDHKYLTHSKIQKDGYDSVYAHGGYDLRNNEFMVYQPNQCTIRYLIELK